MRPALGALGNAPRTLDGVRGPWQQFVDAPPEELPLGDKARLQFAWTRERLQSPGICGVSQLRAAARISWALRSTATLTTALTTPGPRPTISRSPRPLPAHDLQQYCDMVKRAEDHRRRTAPISSRRLPGTNFYGKAATSYASHLERLTKLYQLRTA